MLEADVSYLQDKSVLQVTLLYFCLSTSDGPTEEPQASPVSSNYWVQPHCLKITYQTIFCSEGKLSSHDRDLCLPASTWVKALAGNQGKLLVLQQANPPQAGCAVPVAQELHSVFAECQNGGGRES